MERSLEKIRGTCSYYSSVERQMNLKSNMGEISRKMESVSWFKQLQPDRLNGGDVRVDTLHWNTPT